jgi:hypothetical protein
MVDGKVQESVIKAAISLCTKCPLDIEDHTFQSGMDDLYLATNLRPSRSDPTVLEMQILLSTPFVRKALTRVGFDSWWKR